MSASPILEVDGLSRRFGGVLALRDVSFRLEAGEVLGVIGPNGSGKTTLVGCLSGFIRPSAGRIRFRGRDITGRPAHVVAGMGLVRTFQNVRPFHSLPAYQNLVVPLASPRVARLGGWRGGGRHGDRFTVALDLIEELGFERHARVPYQLAGTLPAGHLKRLDLGRCMALRPDLIVCDELFSGLSASEIASLLPFVERLREQGTTLIMVEHRLRELFRVADRVLALARGEKIAEGAPRTVTDHPLVREAYLGPGEEAP